MLNRYLHAGLLRLLQPNACRHLRGVGGFDLRCGLAGVSSPRGDPPTLRSTAGGTC